MPQCSDGGMPPSFFRRGDTRSRRYVWSAPKQGNEQQRLVREGKIHGKLWTDTDLKFSHSSTDRPDFRRRPKARRFGSFLTLVLIVGGLVAAFVWFAAGATDRTAGRLASDPVVTTLPAPATN